MGATTTLVTVQEFLQMPEPEGLRMELIGGEVVTMSFGHIPHEVVKKNLNKILVVWLAQHPLGEVFAKTMFRLDEYNSLIPDLSVLFASRATAGATGLFQGAPEIAIEVVSSEKATDLENKIELYLAHGARSVWVAFPKQRIVHVVNADGQVRWLKQHQTLEDPGVLPGFSVSVSAIFDGL